MDLIAVVSFTEVILLASIYRQQFAICIKMDSFSYIKVETQKLYIYLPDA